MALSTDERIWVQRACCSTFGFSFSKVFSVEGTPNWGRYYVPTALPIWGGNPLIFDLEYNDIESVFIIRDSYYKEIYYLSILKYFPGEAAEPAQQALDKLTPSTPTSWGRQGDCPDASLFLGRKNWCLEAERKATIRTSSPDRETCVSIDPLMAISPKLDMVTSTSPNTFYAFQSFLKISRIRLGR
jgi:hypothetical protein